jgi:hypothetical protein
MPPTLDVALDTGLEALPEKPPLAARLATLAR